MHFRPLRATLGALVLIVVALLCARSVGPAPALGSFLEPAHGAWSLATQPDLPSDARIEIPGLQGKVDVRYDRRGVPHIFATTEADAYRALGYVVARDRLVQLYAQTMAASGRLTELAGAQALPLDREMRRLGFTWAAARKLAAIEHDSTGSYALTKAYSDGINAWIDAMPASAVPLEFRLLGKKPPRWEPINSIHLLNRMGWTLAYLTPELDRLRAASVVGDSAAAALFPSVEPIQEPIEPNGQRYPQVSFAKIPAPHAGDPEARRLLAMLQAVMPDESRALPDDERRQFASNNWAVSAQRSANGHPLLAGDPHLELTLPSIWYEAHLVVPGKLDVYGVTIPGAPGIIIGFNRDVAWTFTNTGLDVLDYYAERVDDVAHPTKYMVDGAWRPVERRIEMYRGKNGDPIAVDTLYFTHRGPMHRDRDRWISMRWTVLEPSDESAAFQDAAHAKSAAEFEDAMAAHFFAPAQNMLAADRNGIAIRSTGHFPIRPEDGSGLVIRDGTKSANDWQGYLPVSAYPQSFAPTQGYLASANQQPVDPRVRPGYWGGSFDPWRALRINKLLRGDSQMTPEKMRRYQSDPGSERAAMLMPWLLRGGDNAVARGRLPDASKVKTALALLREWDLRYTKDNDRAVLFELAVHELARRAWDELVVTDSTGNTHPIVWPATSTLVELLNDSTSVWWDNRYTKGVIEDRDGTIAASLAAALDSAEAHYGMPNDKRWTWSNVRHANIWNLLRIPSMSALDLPVPGGPETLWPSSGSGNYGPSWRMVVEMGPEVTAMGTYPGGESGNPASPRYEDRLHLWLNGQLDTLFTPHEPDELRKLSGSMTLVPAPASKRNGGAQ